MQEWKVKDNGHHILAMRRPPERNVLKEYLNNLGITCPSHIRNTR